MEILSYILGVIGFLILKTILAIITTTIFNLIFSKIKGRDMSSSKWTQFIAELTAASVSIMISVKTFEWFEIEPNIYLYSAICLVITRMLLFSKSAREGFNKGNQNAVESAFLAFYHSKLNELGVPDSDIDMKTEHLKKDDPIRAQAFSYAEMEAEKLKQKDSYNPTFQMLGNILGVGIWIISTLK